MPETGFARLRPPASTTIPSLTNCSISRLGNNVEKSGAYAGRTPWIYDLRSTLPRNEPRIINLPGILTSTGSVVIPSSRIFKV